LAYIHLAFILLAVYVPSFIWALPTLATISLVFSALFYWLCFSLLAGLKISEVNDDIDVTSAWTSRLVQILATVVLIQAGDTYLYIALFTLPWIVINTLTDAFATLIKWEILAVTDKEE